MGGSELLREVLVWVTVGVGVVGLTGWACRRGSSVLRHALWVLALALFWFLPAAVFAGHQLPLGVLSSPTSYEALGPAPSAEPAVTYRAPAVPESPAPATSPTPLAPATASAATQPVPAREPVWPGLSLWALLALLWGLGVVCELLRGGCDLLALRRLRRSATPLAEATLDTRVAAWAKQVGLRLLPVVRTCPNLAVPGVIGWRRPWLLLPPRFDVTEPGSAAVLIHELAHLKHRHPLLQVVARVTRALWWWHPLAWLVTRQVQVTAEEVCDDWVVALTRQPEVYAQHLVRWAELGQLRGAVAYAHRGRLLVGRVKRVLAQTQTPEVRLTRRARLSLVLGLMVLLSTVVLLRAEPPAPALRVVLRVRTTSEGQWKELARVLQVRVVGYGLPKPVVQKQSGERITVDIPDTKPDPALQANLKSLLTTPGKLEFRAIPKRYAYGTNHPPRHDKDNYTFTLDDPQARPVPTAKVLAQSSLVASSSEVKRDSRVVDQPGQQVQVEFEFTTAGSSRLKSFTESHLNSYFAITVDGKLMMCLLIKSPVRSGKGVIEGGFDTKEGRERAKQLSVMINSGPLPVGVRWGEAQEATPSPRTPTTANSSSSPYNHFAFVRERWGKGDNNVVLATMTDQGLVTKDLPYTYFDPLAAAGGRLYGLTARSKLMAVDLAQNRLVDLGGREYLQNVASTEEASYFVRDGSILEYSFRGRGERSLGQTPGDLTDSPIKVSPDRKRLAFLARPNTAMDSYQLYVLDLTTAEMHTLGQPVRYQMHMLSSNLRCWPEFEWIDAHRIVLVRTSGPARPSASELKQQKNVVTIADLSDGTTRDIATLPGVPAHSVVQLTQPPTWPQVVIKVSEQAAGMGPVHWYTVDARTEKLGPAKIAAGDFRLTVGAGLFGLQGLYYGEKLLASSDQGLKRTGVVTISSLDLHASVSPDRRYVVWQQGSNLHCFDSQTGQTRQAPLAATEPVKVWFTDDDLKPAGAQP